MTKLHLLKELAAQLSAALPTHLGSIKSDFEKNCKSILSKSFAKFDLVTREEFDTQTKVLLRTRQKLESLEQTLKDVEALLKQKAHKDKHAK